MVWAVVVSDALLYRENKLGMFPRCRYLNRPDVRAVTGRIEQLHRQYEGIRNTR